MHELSIAERIIEIADSEIKSRNEAGQVEKVVVKAGRMNAIVPDSLQFHFDVIKKRYERLTEAVLEIEQLPIVGRCEPCSKDIVLEEPLFICEECGGPLAAKSGQELFVSSIVLS